MHRQGSASGYVFKVGKYPGQPHHKQSEERRDSSRDNRQDRSLGEVQLEKAPCAGPTASEQRDVALSVRHQVRDDHEQEVEYRDPQHSEQKEQRNAGKKAPPPESDEHDVYAAERR